MKKASLVFILLLLGSLLSTFVLVTATSSIGWNTPTQLTSNTADDWFSTISGDGSKIAFTSDFDGDYEIFVVNSDGSGLVQLTSNMADDGFPSISGDGSKIAFTSDFDGDYEIYIINSDGSGLVQLTSNTADDGYPSISGDGSKIAYNSNVNGDDEIFVITADTGFSFPIEYAIAGIVAVAVIGVLLFFMKKSNNKKL